MLRGMEITIVTTSRTDDEGRRLLELVGMPFRSRLSMAKKSIVNREKNRKFTIRVRSAAAFAAARAVTCAVLICAAFVSAKRRCKG